MMFDDCGSCNMVNQRRMLYRKNLSTINLLMYYEIAYGNSAIVICSVVTWTSGRLAVNFWVLDFGRAYCAML